MPTRYLSGAYPGGYTLGAGYDGLVIEASASVGGTGVVASQAATISNLGVVDAAGSNYGLHLSAGGAVTNGDLAHAAALIEGSNGVTAGGATSVANFGTIIGDSGIGVLLSAGGSVTNGSTADPAALVNGEVNGVQMSGAATVANFGTIRGQIGFGVVLTAGGTVTNGSAADTGALIVGYNTGVLVQGLATVTNFGAIRGAPFYGVRLTGGGVVTNGSTTDTTATISGQLGLRASGGATTVINFGTISGGGGTALAFTSAGCVLEAQAGCVFLGAVQGYGGTLDLASGSGTITQLSGGSVVVTGSMPTATFSNFGTVEIAAGARFTVTATGAIGGGGTDTLVVGGLLGLEGGAAFAGEFDLGSGGVLQLLPDAGGKVTLSGPASLAGTVEGKGVLLLSNATIGPLAVGGRVSLVDTGTVQQTGAITRGARSKSTDMITIARRATWTIGADVGIALPGLQVDGLLVKSGGSGTSVISAAITDDGTIDAASGTLDLARTLTGSGTLTVDGGATLEADSGAAASLSVTFDGDRAGAVLALGRPAAFAAAISGFAPGDAIDLLAQAASGAALGPGDTLVISRGSRVVATLQLVGNYVGDTFSVASDGAGGTNITVSTGPAGLPPQGPAAPPHAFAAAMARMGSGHGEAWAQGEAAHAPGPLAATPPALARPTP